MEISKFDPNLKNEKDKLLEGDKLIVRYIDKNVNEYKESNEIIHKENNKSNIYDVFKGDTHVFCSSNLEQLSVKEMLRSTFKGDYLESIKISRMQDYMLNQVIIYWPLVGDGVRPKLISRFTSIFLINKLVNERRYIDAYFKGLNSKPIHIASQIYTSILDASIKQIPIDAIAHRIERFKLGKSKDHVFDDMKNIIVEYRSIIEKLGLYDIPMLIDIYHKNLSKDSRYMELMKGRRLVDIDDIVLKCVKKDENLDKNYNIIKDLYYNNYYDMHTGLIESLEYLVNQAGVENDRIVVIVPDKKLMSRDEVDSISETLGFKLRYIPNSQNIKSSYIGNIIFAALSVYRGIEYILSKEEKLDLIRVIYPNKTYIYISNNLEKCMYAIRRHISIERYGEIPDQEFVKKFFKEHFTRNIKENEDYQSYKDLIGDEDMLVVNSFCDHIKDIGILEDSCKKVDFISVSEEAKLIFLKEYASIIPSNATKMELASSKDILVMTLEEYRLLASDRDYLIIFDADSNLYLKKLESNLYTEIAYMDDNFLMNIDNSNIAQIYKDLEFDKNKDYMKKLWAMKSFLSRYPISKLNIYLLHSDLNIGGYDNLGDRRLLWP